MRVLSSTILCLYVCCVVGAAQHDRRDQLQSRLSLRRYAILSQIGHSCVENSDSCTVRCMPSSKCPPFNLDLDSDLCRLYRQHISSTDDEEQKGSKGTESVKTRILFTPMASHTRLSQLTHERETSSLTPYMFLQPVSVIVLHYSPILRRVFLATESPNKVISAALDSTKTTPIRRGYYARLTVDAENKLMFCAHDREIHSMTIKGKLFKVVYTVPSEYGCIKDVTVDSSAGVIFFAQVNTFTGKNNLYSMGYSGKGIQVYVSNSQKYIYHLAYDVITQLLVYNLDNQVKQFNMTSHTHSDLMLTDDLAWIVVDKGIVYLMDGNTLKMFERGTYKTYITLPQSDYNYCFCVIH